MKRYWLHMVKSTEKTAEEFLRKQIREDGPDNGRLPGDVVEGKPTIYLMTDAVSLYCCKESRYYKDATVFEAVKAGVGFIERWQREDGSLDFPTCNFYSAPDTCFCFRRLYGAFRILDKYGETPEEEGLKQRFLVLLLRCIPIVLYGGFHTPNHRWAVMATLYCLAGLVEEYGSLAIAVARLETHDRTPAGQPVIPAQLACRLRKRAAQYLAEGIDCDEDGEYAERSTGNYNAVVDKSLITAYEATGDGRYLEYVARNLEMMLYYFDGDDTVFTQNSTRQDQGKALYPDQYFYLYTYMAAKTGNPLFDSAAHKIIRDNMERGGRAQDCLYIFMMYDWLKEYEFKGYGFLPEYRKYFRGSQVLRVKKQKYVYSVLNHKAFFLFLKFGSFPAALRIGESYCDIRSAVPQELEVKEEGCVLRSHADGWYYQPFESSQGTADWWAMDHSKRDRIVTSQTDTVVSVKELENGLEITVKTEGLEGLPLRVQIDIPAGCILENENFVLHGGRGESMILRGGYLNIRGAGEKLTIGPGFGTHAFKGHYSGDEKNEEGYSIFLNDYTPYERTFRIITE